MRRKTHKTEGIKNMMGGNELIDEEVVELVELFQLEESFRVFGDSESCEKDARKASWDGVPETGSYNLEQELFDQGPEYWD